MYILYLLKRILNIIFTTLCTTLYASPHLIQAEEIGGIYPQVSHCLVTSVIHIYTLSLYYYYYYMHCIQY